MRLALSSVFVLVCVLVCLPGAEPVAEVRLTPADVMTLCAADLVGVSPETAKTTRYVSLHNLTAKKDRDVWAKLITAHLNGLSREPDILPLLKGGDPKSAGVVRVHEHLLRIDTLDFGKVFAEQWERLGAVDYMFHDDDEQVVEEVHEYGFYYDKTSGERVDHEVARKNLSAYRWEKTRDVPTGKKTRKLVRGFAAWLSTAEESRKALEVIQAKTGGTDCPVVTAEFLLYQTAIQADRVPGYYDFLGIRDLATYEKVIGFTRKDIDEGFLKELREAVASSTVTTPDTLRRIVHFDKIGGDYWLTQDSNQKLAKDKNKANALSNLGDDYEFQAVETFGHLPNGMWSTGLFSNAGVRADVAPDFIASDSTAPHTDRRVHVNLGCIRCHTQGGMQDVDGWVRNVLNAPPNALFTTDPKLVRGLRQQYVTRRLEPFLESSRRRYEQALTDACGMKSAEYAAALATGWKEYAEDPVTVERAARDLGCTVAAFQKALADQGAKVDPVLGAFRLPRPRTLPTVLWHRVYGRAQDAVHNINRPFKVKEK